MSGRTNGPGRALQKGDRVEHPEYQRGTFHAFKNASVYIDWDTDWIREETHNGCHDQHLADSLILLEPDAPPLPPRPRPQPAPGDDDEPAARRGAEVSSGALRELVRTWLRTNGIPYAEIDTGAATRFIFAATDEQWEQFEKWRADQN